MLGASLPREREVESASFCGWSRVISLCVIVSDISGQEGKARPAPRAPGAAALPGTGEIPSSGNVSPLGVGTHPSVSAGCGSPWSHPIPHPVPAALLGSRLGAVAPSCPGLLSLGAPSLTLLPSPCAPPLGLFPSLGGLIAPIPKCTDSEL